MLRDEKIDTTDILFIGVGTGWHIYYTYIRGFVTNKYLNASLLPVASALVGCCPPLLQFTLHCEQYLFLTLPAASAATAAVIET